MGDIQRLKHRADFLLCAKAGRSFTRGMVVQGRARHDDANTMRVGFTCTKKVGNAVARNRAKRRLREIAHLHLPRLGKSGWDYVLIGKHQMTAQREFAKLTQDFEDALRELHK